MVKKIKIIVKKGLKTRDGREFTAYKAVRQDGTLVDCRFRRDIEAPTENCIMIIDSGDKPLRDYCNMDRTREYPVLWVAKQPSYEMITRREDDELEEF